MASDSASKFNFYFSKNSKFLSLHGSFSGGPKPDFMGLRKLKLFLGFFQNYNFFFLVPPLDSVILVSIFIFAITSVFFAVYKYFSKTISK